MIKLCPACRSPELKYHGITKCLNVAALNNVNLLRNLFKCLSCGSIIIFPRPSDSALEQYYTKYSEDGSCFADKKGWGKRPAYQTVLNVCKEIGKGKILDVGCADGQLLSIIPSSFQKFGVDISEKNRDLARKKGVSSLFSSLENIHISKRFDIIIALDFIEHVDNPKKTINLISELLTPGGYVIIETGNAGSFFAKILKEDWSYSAVYGHLCVLTPTILCKLALEANIHEVSMKKGWHSTPSLIMFSYRNILSFGFHAFRVIYRFVEPLMGRIDFLRRLYHHAPPGAPHPDHMIFIGKKEI
jgi:2-polyprenyl-3-methyl-5-hydroxy-6-metoxy-1,4-benzoquinol methylase